MTKKLFIFIMLISQLAFNSLAFAQSTPHNFTVTPTYKNVVNPFNFTFELRPGESTKESVSLHNNSEGTIELSMDAADAVYDQDGVPKFPLNQTPQEFGTWITFSEQKVVLGPGETKTIEFEIKIPENAEKKDYIGAIAATGYGKLQENGVFITNLRLAVRTFVKVTDNPQPIEKMKMVPAQQNNWTIIYFYSSITLAVLVVGGFILVKTRNQLKKRKNRHS